MLVGLAFDVLVMLVEKACPNVALMCMKEIIEAPGLDLGTRSRVWLLPQRFQRMFPLFMERFKIIVSNNEYHKIGTCTGV